MPIKVESYDLGWNPRINKGLVRIRMDNGRKAQFNINTLAEFAGWGALLAREPLFVTGNGWIHTGVETMESEGTEISFP
jgi:hypothetical protein